MCRGFVENERETLKTKAFYTNLSVVNATNLPDFLTLHYPTRINGTFLEINGSNIRPDSPAFVTLHRILSEEEATGGVTYGSREKAVVCEGAKFEIYVGDVKVLKGIFRKDEGDCWKIDCKCVLAENDAVKGIEGVEVSVAAEGTAEVMTEKVEMVAARRRRRRRMSCELEEIPEEREREGEFVSGVCWCSECGGKENVDGGDCEMEVEMEEGVHWAVDVGIWVVCFGVGYLVSRASSSRRLRSRRKLMWT